MTLASRVAAAYTRTGVDNRGANPMTTFEERERAFEAKFAFDQETRYRLLARRDKLFAQWAADELKLDDAARAELQRSVLAVTDGAGHDARLLTHMAGRFVDHDQFPLDAYLAAALSRCEVEAQRQLLESPLHPA